MITSQLSHSVTNLNLKALPFALAIYSAALASIYFGNNIQSKTVQLASGSELLMSVQSISSAPKTVAVQDRQAKVSDAIDKNRALNKTERKRHIVKKERKKILNKGSVKRHTDNKTADRRKTAAHKVTYRDTLTTKRQQAASADHVSATETLNRSSTVKAHNRTVNLVYGQSSDAVLLSIKKAIDSNLVYPRRAQLLRHEGEVLIKFRVSGQNISDIKILKSSGSRVLDNAAISTLNKAQSSFKSTSDTMYITIPIVYRLY